jgi:hypothetical protein
MHLEIQEKSAKCQRNFQVKLEDSLPD